MPDLVFDGTHLLWKSTGKDSAFFNTIKNKSLHATSGAKTFQEAGFQCTSDAGPIPEGKYKIPLRDIGVVKVDRACNLKSAHPGKSKKSPGVQTIPGSVPRPGTKKGTCDLSDLQQAWGVNRVPLLVDQIDMKEIKKMKKELDTAIKATPKLSADVKKALNSLLHARDCKKRHSFYIHDSTKGASIGCIEVEPKFFDQLRKFITHNNGKSKAKRMKFLSVEVRYASFKTRTLGKTEKKKSP